MTEAQDHDHDHVEEIRGSEIGDILTENIPTPEDELEATAEEMLEQAINEKIRFVWRPADEIILKRIEIAAEVAFAEMFSAAIAEMNAFYDSLRVPEVNEYGITTGRWKRDEHGRYVELWSQLDGQTTEQCIMNLMRIKLIIAPQITKLRNHAVYAKMVADDIKDDTWKTVAAGTMGDRASKANRVSRVDRYHAFFNYSVWAVADSFQREIVDFMFRLRDVRSWLREPGSNFGWILIGDETERMTARAFASRENPEPSLRPLLEIRFRGRP